MLWCDNLYDCYGACRDSLTLIRLTRYSEELLIISVGFPSCSGGVGCVCVWGEVVLAIGSRFL